MPDPSHADLIHLVNQLLPQIKALLPVWLPGGWFTADGKRYLCGGLRGGSPGSGIGLGVELSTGIWDADSTQRGGLLTLYAAIQGCTVPEAAHALVAAGVVSWPVPAEIPTPAPTPAALPATPPPEADLLPPATALPDVAVILAGDLDTPPSANLFQLWETLGIALTQGNQPICNVDNVLRLLEDARFLAMGLVWYDDFHQRLFTRRGSPTGQAREWADVDTIELLLCLQRFYGFRRLSKDTVNDAVLRYAHAHPRNEPADWLARLTWDSTPRIHRWLEDGLGAVTSDYTRAVSANFWVSMVARVCRPGCKVDAMLVLEGRQGTFKSTALAEVGGPWYADVGESVTSKDFFLTLPGKLIIEIADLDAFERAEVTRIKQVLTCRSDRYRAPYGRFTADHPRRNIFVGTTNEHAYLRDATGARRFWPVRCGMIDLGLIRATREQCFAEAAQLLRDGASWWRVPEASAEEQEARRQSDVWEDVAGDWLVSRGVGPIRIREVFEEAIKKPMAQVTKGDEMRLGKALRKLGWMPQVQWVGGQATRVWVRHEEQNGHG